jgi:hypothetical protein
MQEAWTVRGCLCHTAHEISKASWGPMFVGHCTASQKAPSPAPFLG